MHQRTALEQIKAEIRANGPISFARFTDIALYATNAGYYNRGKSPLGKAGDFVTAPLLSPLFARCLARQIAQLMQHTEITTLCEVGPGDGVLCAQLFQTLAELGCAPELFYLAERSAGLRSVQRRYLQATLSDEFFRRVRWLDDWPAAQAQPDQEAPAESIVIANELLDAIPAHGVRIEAGSVFERRVALDDDRLCWISHAIDDPGLMTEHQAVLLPIIHTLPEGYTTELFPWRSRWLERLATNLQRGVCLLIDYGYPRSEYYHAQRVQGTVRCYRAHRRHDDPLHSPGLDDISVHVEFTRLAEIALQGGMQLCGFSDQAQFLLASGLLEALGDAPPQSPAYTRLAHQVRQLTMPGEMGEAIKLMMLSKAVEPYPDLMTLKDQRHRL